MINYKTVSLFIIVVFMACTGETSSDRSIKQSPNTVIGTWRLLEGVLIENGDTVVTDYTQKVSFIKIINPTHFAFLQHDLQKGKDSTAVFVAGGGRYSLKDSVYTEHLEYCSDRTWEGNDFEFVVVQKKDTLIQRGIEKVESAGVNRINIEKYVRVEK